MPLTPSGKKILKHFMTMHGATKGKDMFHMMLDKGKMNGVEMMTMGEEKNDPKKNESKENE